MIAVPDPMLHATAPPIACSRTDSLWRNTQLQTGSSRLTVQPLVLVGVRMDVA